MVETLETKDQINLAVQAAIDKLGLTQVERKLTHPETLGQEGKFKRFGEWLHAVKYNPADARLKAGLLEGLDTAGGFLVPPEFRAQILMDALEASVIRRSGATVIPMRSDTLNIPKVVDTTHASSVFGGVVAYWTEEAGSRTVSEPTFGQVKLIAKKLTGYTYASDELLADNAIGLEALLSAMFGGALAWNEDDAFFTGDGVARPLGILKSGALLSINRSLAGAVAIADLANMLSRLLPQSHGQAVWYANPGVLTKLVQLASTTLVWMPFDQGMAKSPPATLLGRPIYFTEKCPALGTAGDIILADPRYYLIGDRQALTIASSPHVRFITGETTWRFEERVDGQPWVDSAFTPKNGATLSPFVTLHSATTGGN